MNLELTTWETEPLLEGYDPEGKESQFKIAPAKWIWLPGERTLPCTFAFFRKEFELEKVPKIARGWILADSRYVLYVNGQRVQFGPAPHDPRHAEADPVDIGPYLHRGTNVVAIHVLFYGQGDGTWPTGKPGLLFRANVGKEIIASDNTWMCSIDRSHPPGGAKRWYLRALQERFVGKHFPFGWDYRNFQFDSNWYKAVEIPMSATGAAFSGPQAAYNEDIRMENPDRSTVRGRSIPMMREETTSARMVGKRRIHWEGPMEDWFDFRIPVGYSLGIQDLGEDMDYGHWLVDYELPFTMVGWPFVEFDHLPPNFSSMKLMVQESLHPDKPLMDTQFFAWSSFDLHPRLRTYEPFDYECCRHIQLLISVPHGEKITPPKVNFRRRALLSSAKQDTRVGETELDRLMIASSITLLNSAQDIVVDGMARERQQYAGDGAHQLHAVRLAYGQPNLSRRFLKQFGYGQMLNGVWFDSWPAYDRYARLAQRQIGATGWGSLVDHSVGFVMEYVHHWLQTGDRTPIEENWEGIERFLDYLTTITGLDGLLRVDGIGAETVWIDHDAYQEQAHKKLAFNLYAMQMLAMLDWVNGVESDYSFQFDALRRQFWHDKLGVFVNNRCDVATRPARYCDRAIAHLLWLLAHGYPVAPKLDKEIDLITRMPKSVGCGYPANSIWRHWAWARLGRVDLILKEFRERWATMYSVTHNTTIQEMWSIKPGTTAQLSHCAVAPTIVAQTVLLGIGQDREGNWFIRPQLGDLPSFSVQSYTPWGKIDFEAKLSDGFHRCALTKPAEMPLAIRTQMPIDLPFHDRGKEFSTPTTGMDKVEFDVHPYPTNQLIMEVEGLG